MTGRPRTTGPLQVKGEVLSIRRVGDYYSITLVAPGIAERTAPGHFVALAVGGPQSAMLLRRSFSIYRVSDRGVYGGTVEIVMAVHGPGTEWLAGLRPHDPVDVVGPLGKPFPLPKHPVRTVLVGGGYGSAPLFPLAEALRARGCRVDFVLGAATQSRLFGALDAKRIAATVTVTTDDGSYGQRGWVSDVLPAVLERSDADLVYACGPMAMLASVTAIAEARGVVAQCAVEEAMACGIGVCMTCVLPVVGDDGQTRMVRSCTDGPVFDGTRVRWADVGTVPPDTVGAPAAAGASASVGVSPVDDESDGQDVDGEAGAHVEAEGHGGADARVEADAEAEADVKAEPELEADADTEVEIDPAEPVAKAGKDEA